MGTERIDRARDTTSRHDNDAIEPAVFTPATTVRRRSGRRIRPLALVLAAALCVGGFVMWFLFTARSVEIAVSPDSAKMMLSGGLRFKLADRYLLRTGRYLINAHAAGYEPLTKHFDVDTRSQQRFEFALIKLPGHLKIQSTPIAEAEIWVDGELRGTTPATIMRLAPGEHAITLTAPRYRSFSTQVVVEGLDKTQELNAALAPAWADVTISTEPPGATVAVEGTAVGITPLTTDILEGRRDVEVSLTGYQTWRDRLNVTAGEALALPLITLRRADGRVTVRSKPEGAAVTLNDSYQGVTPLTLALIPDDDHQLRLHKEGYMSARQSLRVKSGQTRSLTVELTPEFGAVSFRIEPHDAILYVNGKAVSDSSSIMTLSVRDHVIKVSKTGYVDYQGTVRPRPGVEQLVTVKLKTIEEAKWDGIKPLTQTAAGQQMKLFRPNASFTMGSSRREQGRRSNEVLRKVTLTRPFYLSLKEVTNAEFRRFARTHSSRHVKGVSLDSDDQPVVQVSWQDAALYCNWLSEQESLTPFYRIKDGKVTGFDADSLGYRLPTEAEWTWVARVASDAGLRKYPWGNSLPPTEQSGNYADRSAAQLAGKVLADYVDDYAATAPVGRFNPNEKGLYDLGGNVAEWVHDYYGIQANAMGDAHTDPVGPATGEYHVIRGSSWAHGTISELRLAFRDYGVDPRDDVGFRIARWVE